MPGRRRTGGRRVKPIKWPRDLASIPTLSRLKTERAVACRTCKHAIAPSTAHVGVTYRGRYGVATSHLCGSCAALYLRDVYSTAVLGEIARSRKDVAADPGIPCSDCVSHA
jgi:hypothetical protein